MNNRIYCKRIKIIKGRLEKCVYSRAYHELCGSQHIIFNKLDNDLEFIYAYINKKPIGVIELYTDDRDITNLNMVYVLKTYRRKGVMRSMFKHILKKNDRLEWTSSYDATEAYLKIGATRRTGSLFKMEKGQLR